MQFEVGTLEEVDELGISSCSCSTGVDIGSDVVDLLAVLFDHDGASGGSGVGSEDDSSIEFDSDDGGTCFFVGNGLACFFVLQELVAEWSQWYRWVSVKSNPPI